MSISTATANWGVVSLTNISGGTALSIRGSLYIFRNFDNGDRFVFALADLALGPSIGFKINKAAVAFFKLLKNSPKQVEPDSFTKIKCNRAFAADDLNWSPGAEATIGATLLVAGYSTTLISAWPFFQGAPKPGAEVNNDYFSGAEVVSAGFLSNIGLEAKAAWSLQGRWFRLSYF